MQECHIYHISSPLSTLLDFRALMRADKYRDTMIVFMSDNGGAEKGSNWPLRGGKNSVWEGGTKSVAFVHYPRYGQFSFIPHHSCNKTLLTC